MTQYPNEKDPHPEWVSPPEQRGAPSGYPPPSQNPPYSLPPGPPSESSDYAAPPQAQAQYYEPPQGPPPSYTYDQNQPSRDKSVYDPDAKGPATPYDAYGAPGSASRAAPSASYLPPPPSSSSMASRDGNSDGTMSLGSFFGSEGTPRMWQRPAPPQLPYTAFPPMCLLSNNKDLTGGFPVVPPPCALDLHPFATHDVAEEDWRRFLEDVKKAAKLSISQRIKSNVIPLVTGMSLVGGFVATFAIEKRMKNKNRQAAGDLVDHWNYYFFGPRRMEVVLCQGSERLSGKMGAVPIADLNQQRMAEGLRQRRRSSSRSSSSSSSSSSSCDEGHGRGSHDWKSDKHARKAARRERRQLKREAKRERREEKRARKARGENKMPYQLVVVAI